jgi:hypothetical protein
MFFGDDDGPYRAIKFALTFSTEGPYQLCSVDG